ncbi:uncharacterized protein LOC6559690 [Drosophila grimshawi]|uniref:GH19759 n=1 Tax=Drosophila grimshawi TaxID=7222 RepID=B4J453_DROGR|nr:uncharacterized protein LOC6559690 [Drosophila grimshawi]EDW02659.1 GH19759 [Drosophila grimshawi]
MSTTQPTDVQYLRCLKCLKIVKCSRYDTSCLVRHVQKDHPEMLDDTNDKVSKLAAGNSIRQERILEISRITEMLVEEMADKADRYLERKQRKSSQKGEDDYKKCEKKPKAVDSDEINRRHYYRSSIERWIPIEGCIYCPNCGCKRSPLIMTSCEFYASTHCFWPFCFLPCLSTGDNREYLRCSNCKSFLAIYDRKRNCIRPNWKFVAR